MSSQSNDLVDWINEIVTNSLNAGDPLMHNYINETCKLFYFCSFIQTNNLANTFHSRTATFLDVGGSALIAYSTFRLARMATNVDLSEELMKSDAIYTNVQSKIDHDGQLIQGSNVVNPLTFTSPSQGSPESMAFLVLMTAARRDYAENNVTSILGPTANAALHSTHFAISHSLLAVTFASMLCFIML